MGAVAWKPVFGKVDPVVVDPAAVTVNDPTEQAWQPMMSSYEPGTVLWRRPFDWKHAPLLPTVNDPVTRMDVGSTLIIGFPKSTMRSPQPGRLGHSRLKYAGCSNSPTQGDACDACN
jgi:hypothetical protein